MIWAAVLVCAVGCYLLKLAGLSIPPHFLEKPLVQRLADLVPIALLAALITVQVFSTGTGSETHIAVDARLAGLGAAVIALLLRAPFLVVVLVSALTAALLRLI